MTKELAIPSQDQFYIQSLTEASDILAKEAARIRKEDLRSGKSAEINESIAWLNAAARCLILADRMRGSPKS